MGVVWWLVDSGSVGGPQGTGSSVGDGATHDTGRAELDGGAPDRGDSTSTEASAASPVSATSGPASSEVVGRVVDERGRLVAGAGIRVRREFTAFGVSSMQEDRGLVSDADGTFRLAVPNGASRELHVVATSAMSASETRMIASDAGRVTLHVQVEPNLSGVVVDGSGKPLAREPVMARTRAETGLAETKTDEHGRFELRVLPDRALVDVKAGLLESELPAGPGQLVGEIKRDVPLGTHDLQFRLLRAVAMQAVLVGEDDKALQLQYLRLKYVSSSGARYWRPMIFTRSAGGAYELGCLRTGEWKAYALPQHPRYGITKEVQFSVPGPPVRLVSRLTEGIKGCVVGLTEGFRGGRLRYLCRSGDSPVHGGLTDVDQAGRFHITRTSDGPYNLYFCDAHSQHVAKAEGVRPGVAPVELPLEPGMSLSGVVLSHPDRADPVLEFSQDWVVIHAGVTQGGQFDIPGMFLPGEWEVRVCYEMPEGTVKLDPVVVRAGSTGNRIDG